ncbi:alpha/beta hydrolase [Micromonospora sp. RTGN7]|uniref:alpha/beta fold hydrolase n=1 Tax=Micromonospora sp. RTGN7 TaxID=3016526 RepID=UPI0029FF4190|nr:alpha/beta hydrolase [Micromonospora sp. RTGN7]
MEHQIDVAPGVRLWAEERGDPAASTLLLVMGANASGLTWPDSLLDALARRHRVIRYDHRDTGRSTWPFAEHPYPLTELATDVVRLLDALGIARAHVVGMSMGGMLTQLLLLEHPERLATATLVGTTPMDGAPTDLPGIDPTLLEFWETMFEPRDRAAEIAWRVRHWRILNGGELPFDPEEFRRREERIIDHAGRPDNPAAHALASQDGLDRAVELAAVSTPVLVVDSPADPIAGSASARHLATLVGNARLVTVPGLGHALSEAVGPRLAEVILDHTTSHEPAERPLPT